MDVTQSPFVGRTQALRTNWCYYHPSRLLIDAGDGVSIDLGDRVGTPRRLCLTHAHSDHILGLFNLALARQLPSTVSGGPLDIYYPEGSFQIAALQQAMSALWPRTVFDRLIWHPTNPETIIPLGVERYITPFATDHIAGALTLGYAATQTRTRIKPEYAELPQAELNTLIQAQGRNAVTQTYTAVDFVHTGDTRAHSLDTPMVTNAKLAIVDCTFLSSSDKDYDTHASLDEIIDVLSQAPIKTLVLHHFSQRYPRSTLATDVARVLSSHTLRAQEIYLWDDMTLTNLNAL